MRARIQTIAWLLLVGLTTGCMTESYLRRGDAASAAGRPEEALHYYERVYRGSSKYRNDPAFQNKMRHTHVEALLVQARRYMAGKRWDDAMRTLDQALSLEPSSGTARQLQAEAKHGAAGAALSRACQAADKGRLADARQECARGLTYEPANPELLQAQRSLSPDAPGKETLAQAARLVDQRRWKQADTVLGTLLESYPYHLAARNRRAEVRHQLAEESRLLGVAKVETRNGDLVGAEKNLVELLKNSPHHGEASSLLGSVRGRLAEARSALAASKAADKRGRPGMALQQLYAARKAWPRGVPDAEITRLQDALRDLYPVQVTWEARGSGAALVRGALADKLGTGAPDRGTTSYHLVVQVSQGPARVETVSTEQLHHQFVTQDMQPNPDLPDLRHDARRWEMAEREWRRRQGDAVRKLQQAEHHLPEDDPHREEKLRRLKREADRARNEMRDAERQADRAHRRLRSAPGMVMVSQTLTFPYVRRTLKKTLTVSAAAVMSFAGQDVTSSTSFSRSGMSQDTVIDGANPSLGLPQDRLALASDQALAANAGDALGQDVAAWAWQVAWQAWAGQLAASAEQLERQGKTDDAGELRMAAAAYQALQAK